MNIFEDGEICIGQVFGLADIYLSEVLVTRDQTLYDLKMMAQFRCILPMLIITSVMIMILLLCRDILII